jgi:hypothetical protein
MQIDCSDVQESNANGSKTVTEQPLSNVTVERELQLEKQWQAIAVTDDGIQIECNEVQESNPNGPKTATEQPFANETVERAEQLEKQ